MSSETVIYALVDPRTNQIRYVGKSGRHCFRDRMYGHVAAARRNEMTHCHRWIRALLRAGLRPNAIELEVVHDNWQEAEKKWIAKLRADGIPLLNHTDGGDGAPARKLSDAAKAAMVRVHLGAKRSEEARQRMRDAWTPERIARHRDLHSGKTITADQREAISRKNKGRKFDPEVVERRAAKLRGRRQSSEQRAKSGAGIKASWTPERRAAQAERMREMRRRVPNTRLRPC